jgi:chemotaxis protein CheX
MIDDLDELVRAAGREVFDTMLNFQLETQPPGTSIPTDEPHIAGAVGFIGHLSGVVYVYASAHFAREITSALLGLPETDTPPDEMVNDAIGELTNMIVGHIKSRLADRGMPCALTIPSIVRGSHFTIEAVTSTTRRLCAFSCRGHQMAIDILLKPANSN